MSNSPQLQERIKRELDAHTVSDVLAESYRLKDRFFHIWSYPSRQRLSLVVDEVLRDVSGKKILDYGCGRGNASINYLARGAQVHGIDISPAYLEEAKRKAEEAGYPLSQYEFHAMDAHALEFEDNTFDLVVGEGILHHLDAELALDEIRRVLRPGGRVLLREPLAGNPLLKIFRVLTPHARTADERPFTGADIRNLIRPEFWRSDTTYCGVIEAPVAVIASVVAPRQAGEKLLHAADKLERWIHARDLLMSWNQYILFNLIKL